MSIGEIEMIGLDLDNFLDEQIADWSLSIGDNGSMERTERTDRADGIIRKGKTILPSVRARVGEDGFKVLKDFRARDSHHIESLRM